MGGVRATKYAISAVLACAVGAMAAAPASAATLSAQVPASLPVGTAMSSTATVTGGDPTGTVIFDLFGPDTGCGGEEFHPFPSVKPINGDATVSSDPFTPTVPGTYYWKVSYASGQPSVTLGCPDLGLGTVVRKRVPDLGPSATVTAIAGQTLTQTQTLAGAYQPAGFLNFALYGPNDTTCSRAPVAAGTRQVGGEGAYTSDPVVVKSDGVYRWQATYSGDERNESVVSTSCPTGDKIRPVLGTPTISPSRLKPGKKAIIKYSLSEAATVAFSVERALPGRRSGKSCGKPTTKNAGKKKCTRYVKLKGGFSQRGRKGSNKLSFNGKLGKKKLAPGSYRLRAVATDAAKNKSAAKLRSFRILP